MRRGRILALDFGERNIGLACSDELGLTVQPLPSIPRQTRNLLAERLRELIREHAVSSLVVGMPWNMDGSAGPAAEKVSRFIQFLAGELGLPLSQTDERLSTLEARELWQSMGPRQKRKYRTVDSVAAAIILERHLREE